MTGTRSPDATGGSDGSVASLAADLVDSLPQRGQEMMAFAEKAYPIPRSLTGDGVRETLALLRADLPDLAIHEVPSGTPVLDWEVPKEWNVRSAWLRDANAETVVDFADHNLHLLGYSTSVSGRFTLDQLRPHLFSNPDVPDAIPYRTSYYAERWGFCLPDDQLRALEPGEYEVSVDTSLENGSLTYGELLLPGRSEREVLISTHCCHPSLANDNLSGLAVASTLARELASLERDQRRYSYRFLFVPGTIGAITWLARNPRVRERVVHGVVLANLGDSGDFHYKRSRGGTLAAGEHWPIDRAVAQAAQRLDVPLIEEDFVPFGYDERQYCSPGFDLPVGSLSRTPWGRYPEYHTSKDDLSLVSADSLAGSLQLLVQVCAEIESMDTYRNALPNGEPQLGKRGLYRTLGGDDKGRERELALLWVLSLSDGRRSTADIARCSGLSIDRVDEAVEALLGSRLLEPW